MFSQQLFFASILNIFVWIGLKTEVGLSIRSECRCVPDQWEGLLKSQEREFDMVGGQTAMSETMLYMRYDFVNKKLSVTDMKSNTVTIADYAKGYKYIIRNGVCNGWAANDPMFRMCLPGTSVHLGSYTLGNFVPIEMWQFSAPGNVTVRTVSLPDNCVPLYEEVNMDKGEYISHTTSWYLNLKLEVDQSAFDPPADCSVEGNKMASLKKRQQSDVQSSNQLLNALKNRLYIFH